MPKDYNLEATPANQQRRNELVQDDEWINEFLQRASIGHIATRWDEQPFITPTTYWYDGARHEIYFHSNVVGRIRANSEHHDRVCFEASEFGKLLPSNVALEFSIQFESVIAFGSIRVLEDAEEKRFALSNLLGKYFPQMTAGKEYRPITDEELKRTSVYAIAIESWSGKRNWPEQADQGDEWLPLIAAQAN
ncbi:MAG TPA: pyridoxamine 5'-phosphate oxidase family protein [Anaerolineae bacterium]|nr:pyridoxamine 5'-phosphate oxidase family protein [Anaerolineae bacterium]